jgi:hypothetical protein
MSKSPPSLRQRKGASGEREEKRVLPLLMNKVAVGLQRPVYRPGKQVGARWKRGQGQGVILEPGPGRQLVLLQNASVQAIEAQAKAIARLVSGVPIFQVYPRFSRIGM